jgi:hypothetical protein
MRLNFLWTTDTTFSIVNKIECSMIWILTSDYELYLELGGEVGVKDVIRKDCPSISICKPPLI